MSEFDSGVAQYDDEIDEIIWEAYVNANKDYLREQAILALVASGKSRKEAEEWIRHADVGIAWKD